MASIEEELDIIAKLDRRSLAERWAAAFGCPAPKYCQAQLLRSALAWQLQMDADPEWRGAKGRARLLRLLRQNGSKQTRLGAGAELLREWQGRMHRVVVRADGFEYEGKVYRSLSAVARRITGTPWSGPRFFGLPS